MGGMVVLIIVLVILAILLLILLLVCWRYGWRNVFKWVQQKTGWAEPPPNSAKAPFTASSSVAPVTQPAIPAAPSGFGEFDIRDAAKAEDVQLSLKGAWQGMGARGEASSIEVEDGSADVLNIVRNQAASSTALAMPDSDPWKRVI